MNRRKAMQILILGGAAGLIGLKIYLGNNNMERLKPTNNRIPADLHIHLNRDVNIERLLLDLPQPSLIGIASYSNPNASLNYHDFLGYKNFKEIDTGILGIWNHDRDIRYVLNVQEMTLDHHISALGCKQKITARNSFEAVKEIKKQNGIAILNHPFIVPGSWKRYRLINQDEEIRIDDLAKIVDEIETFNGQCISLIPYIIDMEKANEKAKKFAEDHGFKGIATSDAHFRSEQVLTSGIYIPKGDLTFAKLKEYIEGKKFESEENYITRNSFLKGHFPFLEYII